MNDTHHHGGSAHLDLPDPGELITLLRSVQSDLSDLSGDAAEQTAERIDQAADGIAALGDALDKERAYSAHVKQHLVDCEASESYRVGHALVRAAKLPKQFVASLRSGRS